MKSEGPPATTTRRYGRELLLNQVWQGLNFLIKAGSLALLTPLMMRVWGKEGYGLFALASSLLVSLAALDFGIRNLTRLRLVQAEHERDQVGFSLAIGSGLFSFLLVVLVALLLASVLGVAGLWSAWLKLPKEGDWLLPLTVALTGTFMASVLLLEPQAARGRISDLKAVNSIGALVSIFVVGGALLLKGSVTTAVALNFVCLVVPNILWFFWSGLAQERPWSHWGQLRGKDFRSTFHAGAWYYTYTLTSIIKTHAMTFVISAVAGAGAAGVFYIMLRISEIISGLGATSSDTTTASVASARTPEEKAQRFQHSYQYALIFCAHGALVVGFLGDYILRKWLGEEVSIRSGTGWAVALFGLATAFGRFVVTACMGIGRVRIAALGCVAEAVVAVLSCLLLYGRFGLPGVLIGISCGSLFLVPGAIVISHHFHKKVAVTWFSPLGFLVGTLTASAAVLLFAAWRNVLLWAVVAAGLSAFLVLLDLKRLHKREHA